MPRKMRFGLIGAGTIAQSYAQAFQCCESATLVAVADVRFEAAQALALATGCRSYDSYEQLAIKNDIDAVIICTPPSTHAEIGLFFLGSGRDVLCEKPLSISLETAHQMIQTARKLGRKLTMASKFRYVEDLIRAKNLVTSGILGEIVLVENVFAARVEMKSRWNSVPTISGGGVLIDNGTHSVDIMRYFLGPIAEVSVVEGKRVQALPVEDTVHMFIRSDHGIMGSIDLSWSINKEIQTYLSVYGSLGTIHVGWKGSRYRQSSSAEWINFGHGYDKIEAFRSQIENFARHLQGEERLLITAEDAIASVQVIEAAYASLAGCSWTTVPVAPKPATLPAIEIRAAA